MSKVLLAAGRVRAASEISKEALELMRTMYNHCIPAIATRADVTENTPEEQKAWWEGLDFEKFHVHLYYPKHLVDMVPSVPIAGFSIVRDRGSYVTPFFCTHHAYHGKGIGRQIVEHYISVAKKIGKPMRGEHAVSNAAIRHINSTVGWKVVGREDRPGVGEVELLVFGPLESANEYPDYQEMLKHWIDSD